MYLDATVLTAGALRLLQLLLNPFIQAGLQSAASPNNNLPYVAPVAPVAPLPPSRQVVSAGSAAALLSQLGLLPPLSSALGSALGSAVASAVPAPSGSLAPGSMTVASMPAVPMPPMAYAPWLFAQPLPAVPSTPTGPVFVPPSVVSSLLPPVAVDGSQAGVPASPPDGQVALSNAAANAALDEAVAPYLPPSSSIGTPSPIATDVDPSQVAAPMPMASLLSLLSSLAAGVRVVAVHFAASLTLMGVVKLVRVVVDNLPIILRVLGLSSDAMARVVVQGVMRAQCLQRAACVLGRHAATYPSTPEVMRWLRSPDPGATAVPEHPVWSAFRAAAEGTTALCNSYAC